MSKTALVVSGGGSKGAFAVGAVKYLAEKGFKFDLVSGTSTGALIAPMVAINDIPILEKIYTSVETKDILRHNWRKLYWNALFDTKPLEKLIRRNLIDKNRYQNVVVSDTTILICAVNLQTEATTYFTQKEGIPNTIQWKNMEEFIQCILASTNQPLFTPAIKIRGQQYVDGGIREIIPVQAAIDAGCDKLVVISNSPGIPRVVENDFKNFLSVGARTLSVMSSETNEGDIDSITEYNELLKYIEGVKEKTSKIMSKPQIEQFFSGGEKFGKSVDITLIRPKDFLPMDGLKFEPEKMLEAYKIGYARAKEIINL